MHASEVKPGERVKNVQFTEDTIAVDLMDGRTIVVPLAWYPTHFDATPAQRSNWKVNSTLCRLVSSGYPAEGICVGSISGAHN